MSGWGIPRGWPYVYTPTPPGGECFIEELVLDATDVNVNKYKALSHTPLSISEVALDIIHGIRQDNGTDYNISLVPARINWAELGLDGVLEVGDIISIIYTI